MDYKILSEYPRPHLIRESFTSLNGIWNYQIIKKGSSITSFFKDILVCFSISVKASKTNENIYLKKDEELWYRKKFIYKNNPNKNTILNFEAVNQNCIIYLNGALIYEHQGGYNPFSVDISKYIKEENEILLKITNDTENSINSGIWQSVWIEEVSKEYIEDIFYTCDYDNKKIIISLVGEFNQAIITISENGKLVTREITKDKSIEYTFNNFIPWSVDNPFLYDVYIETENDIVKSYFGMRKISLNNNRVYLNNEEIILCGIMDNGYIKDYGYTYPSSEFIVNEISNIKKMGFNFIKKLNKQDSRMYYYICDKLGMLIMQDSISFNQNISNLDIIKNKLGISKIKEDNSFYLTQLNDMVLTLYNNPCIFSWSLTNLYNISNTCSFLLEIDNSRLINCMFDDSLSEISFKKQKRYNKNLKSSLLVLDSKKYKDEISLVKYLRNKLHDLILKGLNGYIYNDMISDKGLSLFTKDRKNLNIQANKLAAINYKLKRRKKKKS